MIHSLIGLMLTAPQEHGLVGLCFFFIVHAIELVAARHPYSTQSQDFPKWSLDGVDKLFMVTMIPELHQWLSTAWPFLFAAIALLESGLVHDCRQEKNSCGKRDSTVMRKNKMQYSPKGVFFSMRLLIKGNQRQTLWRV